MVVLEEAAALEEDLDFEAAAELIESFLEPRSDLPGVRGVLIYNMAPLYRKWANLLEAQARFEEAIRLMRLLVEAATFRHKEYLKEASILRRGLERRSIAKEEAKDARRMICEFDDEMREIELELACYYRDLGLLFYKSGQSEKGKLMVSKACSMLVEMHFKLQDNSKLKKKQKNMSDTDNSAYRNHGHRISLLMASFCPDLGLICEMIGGNTEVTSCVAQNAHISALQRDSACLGHLTPQHPLFGTMLNLQSELNDNEFSEPETRRDLRRIEAITKRHRSVLGSKSIILAGLLLGGATLQRRLFQFENSKSLLEEAASIVSHSMGDKSSYYATVLMHQSIHAQCMGDLATAEEKARKSLEIRNSIFGETDNIHSALSRYDLALILSKKLQSTRQNSNDATGELKSKCEKNANVQSNSHPNLAPKVILSNSNQRNDGDNTSENYNVSLDEIASLLEACISTLSGLLPDSHHYLQSAVQLQQSLLKPASIAGVTSSASAEAAAADLPILNGCATAL